MSYAGGLPKSDLRYIVGPGETGTNPTNETIGIFGVGTKRAVVALAQDVKITTRFPKEKTYQINFGDNWLEDENWELPIYEVDEVSERKTIVELQTHLKEHLRTTYAKFLTNQAVTLQVNVKPFRRYSSRIRLSRPDIRLRNTRAPLSSNPCSSLFPSAIDISHIGATLWHRQRFPCRPHLRLQGGRNPWRSLSASANP